MQPPNWVAVFCPTLHFFDTFLQFFYIVLFTKLSHLSPIYPFHNPTLLHILLKFALL